MNLLLKDYVKENKKHIKSTHKVLKSLNTIKKLLSADKFVSLSKKEQELLNIIVNSSSTYLKGIYISDGKFTESYIHNSLENSCAKFIVEKSNISFPMVSRDSGYKLFYKPLKDIIYIELSFDQILSYVISLLDIFEVKIPILTVLLNNFYSNINNLNGLTNHMEVSNVSFVSDIDIIIDRFYSINLAKTFERLHTDVQKFKSVLDVTLALNKVNVFLARYNDVDLEKMSFSDKSKHHLHIAVLRDDVRKILNPYLVYA